MQLEVIAFDWGHTVMDENRDREVPLDARPIHVMPGASEVLPHLALPLALGANTRLPRESDLRGWLERAGFGGLFRWVITSVDAGARKPATQFFRVRASTVWTRQRGCPLYRQSAEHRCGWWSGIRNLNGVAIGIRVPQHRRWTLSRLPYVHDPNAL
jgi:hypothetical protein